MRRANAALLLALAAGAVTCATPAGALGAVGTPAAAAAGRAHIQASSCAPRGARTLARSAALHIYETPPRTGGVPRAVLACLSGHRGHMTLLAPTRLNQHTSLARFELAGHVAAYLETQFGVDSGTRKLVVVDVGARRVLHAIEAGSYVDAGLVFDEAVIRFLVSSQGSLAWTVTREDHRSPAVESVWALAREGAPALLDTGQAIDAGSLARVGTTLTWTDAGTQRTAPMP